MLFFSNAFILRPGEFSGAAPPSSGLQTTYYRLPTDSILCARCKSILWEAPEKGAYQPEEGDIYARTLTYKQTRTHTRARARYAHDCADDGVFQVVEMILATLDVYGAGHPIHLHGHKFHVLALAPVSIDCVTPVS